MRIKRNQYLMQFACFECRKAFKQALPQIEQDRAASLSRRISGRKPTEIFREIKHTCPQCSKPLTLMGRAFRAPRNGDLNQWHKVEILARNGFTFWSHVGRYPDTANEAKVFVNEKRKRSKGEKLAQKIARVKK